MKIKDRIKQFTEYKGISVQQFEKTAGLSNATVSKMGDNARQSTLDKISNAYPELNMAWLRIGIGDMINESDARVYLNDRRAKVPLVSQYAQAGYLVGYNSPEYMNQLPTIDFTPDREMTGNYLAFEIKGDSMDDGSKQSYIEGEIVICREVEPYLWRDSKLHINRRDFVIVHEEGILIKRIIAHDVPNHTITIHSLNPMYPDREIDLAQVRQIFSVVESRMGRLR